jgi:Protein of unknown function (DUF1573)
MIKGNGQRICRRRAVSLAAALGLGIGLCAASVSAAPKLSVATPRKEIGDLIAGDTAVVEFPLTNTGTDPLKIEKVATSCGCTTTTYPEVLQPGERGVLRAKLASATIWNGPIEKEITLTTNDPEQKEVTLQLTAQMHPLFKFTPPNPYAVPYRRGEVIRQVFVITAADPATRITAVTSNEADAKARLLPQTSGDDTWRVEVTVNTPDSGRDFTTAVLLQTTHPKVPTIPLIVTGMSREVITASPRVLYMGTVGTGPSARPPMMLAVSRRFSGFHVRAVTTDTPALKAEVRPTGADNVYEIHLRYVGGWKPGKVSGKITVTTDDPGWPKVEIPYEALVEAERPAKPAASVAP